MTTTMTMTSPSDRKLVRFPPFELDGYRRRGKRYWKEDDIALWLHSCAVSLREQDEQNAAAILDALATHLRNPDVVR
jgi:hypothetical protein